MASANDDTNVSLTTAAELERTPQGLVRRWLAEWTLADRDERDWRKEATDLYAMYEGGKKKAHAFNVLWANTELLLPAVYNSMPQPDVRRRFRDADPIGKGVSAVLERALATSVDVYDFDHEAESFVLDMLLTGRGVLRVKYQPSFDPTNADKLLAEQVECECVQWDRFRRGPGKRWAEVPWVGFSDDYTQEMAEEAFGPEVAAKLTYVEGKDAREATEDVATRSVFKTCEVLQLWDRDRRRVLFLAPSYKDAPLLVTDDPLHLRDFYPVPRPGYAIKNTRTLVPVPLYRLYAEQAKELDRVSARINKIVDALRLRGAYSANLAELANLFDADDRQMIPVENVSELSSVGGLDKAIWTMPVERLVQVLNGLYQARDQIKATIYELTGLSDIVRGATDPNETASAQQIKSRWGSLRLQRLQREASRTIRDVLRLKAEVIAERFSPQTLEAVTNLDFPTAAEKQQAQAVAAQAQAMQQPVPAQVQAALAAPAWEELLRVMRSDQLRQYRVDVETDSTVQETVDRDFAGLREVMGAVGEVFAGVQAGLPGDVAKEVALAVARRARLGGAVEDALDQFQPTSPEDDVKRMTEQVMGLVEQQSGARAEQMKAQETQQANLAQYDEQARAALGGVQQVGAAVAQGFQRLATQHQQILQALAATLERLNAAPVMQNADALQGTLTQVADGFERVIEAVAAPKDVEFVADRHGVPKGARLTSTKAQGLQRSANAVASNTVAALQSIAQQQSAHMEQLIAAMNSGLQAVLDAVSRPKSVQFTRGSDGRIAGATAELS